MSVAAGGYLDGTAWAAGPDRVYGLLADAAMGLLPGDLSGVLALDAGAGTGAVARALRRRGARTVSSDLSPAMLAAGPAPAFAADIRSLPLGDGTIDLAVAAMVLSHLTDPGAALAELVRVTRPGGTVLATAFPAGPGHPVAVAANRALAAQGFRAPDWYTEMKTIGEARVGTAGAARAGNVRRPGRDTGREAGRGPRSAGRTGVGRLATRPGPRCPVPGRPRPVPAGTG